MADPNRIAGTASITVDGNSMNIAGELTYQLSVPSRETLTGQDGPHGFAEKPQPGFIKLKGRDEGGNDIAALNNASGVTVTAVLANGKIVSGSNMWRSGDAIQVSTEDGAFEVQFDGTNVQEILS